MSSGDVSIEVEKENDDWCLVGSKGVGIGAKSVDYLTSAIFQASVEFHKATEGLSTCRDSYYSQRHQCERETLNILKLSSA